MPLSWLCQPGKALYKQSMRAVLILLVNIIITPKVGNRVRYWHKGYPLILTITQLNLKNFGLRRNLGYFSIITKASTKWSDLATLRIKFHFSFTSALVCWSVMWLIASFFFTLNNIKNAPLKLFIHEDCSTRKQ